MRDKQFDYFFRRRERVDGGFEEFQNRRRA
jgi:hypothetical protein